MWTRAARGACRWALLLAVAAPVRTAWAQESVLERLGIDRLRFSGLGAQVGVVTPARVVPTNSFSLVADYGEIAPRWRVVFHATYWGSRLKDHVVRAYADSLRHVVVDPSGDDLVQLGDVAVSDIALATDVRREYGRTRWFRPFIGGGIAAHVVNVNGRLIDGTFVERALDNFAIGLSAVAGVEARFLGHLAVNAHARYDLMSLARVGSLRAGGTYYFDPPTPRRESR